MTPAGKLELILALYNRGMLCSCTEVDYDSEEEDKPIIHKDDCIGKAIVRELLSFPSEEKP